MTQDRCVCTLAMFTISNPWRSFSVVKRCVRPLQAVRCAPKVSSTSFTSGPVASSDVFFSVAKENLFVFLAACGKFYYVEETAKRLVCRLIEHSIPFPVFYGKCECNFYYIIVYCRVL